MPDPARARRLAKRISTIVASAIEYEIKDPRLAGVTITDAKVTGDLHDATLFYTVFGRQSRATSRTTPARRRRWRAPRACCARGWAPPSACASPRRWRSCATPCPTRRTGWKNLLARARAADEDLARVRQGAKHAGDADPYRVTGAEASGELDDELTLRTPVTAIDKMTDAPP